MPALPDSPEARLIARDRELLRNTLHAARVARNEVEAALSSLHPGDASAAQYARWEAAMERISDVYYLIGAAISELPSITVDGWTPAESRAQLDVARIVAASSSAEVATIVREIEARDHRWPTLLDVLRPDQLDERELAVEADALGIELDALAGDRPENKPYGVRVSDDPDDLVWSPDATLEQDGTPHRFGR
jgi:hypothetical protein